MPMARQLLFKQQQQQKLLWVLSAVAVCAGAQTRVADCSSHPQSPGAAASSSPVQEPNFVQAFATEASKAQDPAPGPDLECCSAVGAYTQGHDGMGWGGGQECNRFVWAIRTPKGLYTRHLK
jgi:hypothetical protein